MNILAVDTSLPALSVALLSDGRPVAAIALEGANSRNEKLLPAVDWAFDESGFDRTTLELLAVTRGPGSFTGVRVGLATIQGLSAALDLPVCAMSTHQAIAHGHSGPTLVYGDAGRSEFYASVWDGAREVVAPQLATQAELERLQAEYGEGIAIASLLATRNVALELAHAAAAFAKAGSLERFADVTPIYVRLAEAEVRLANR
jgi:tRNA threonylcarbamoyladenosine biosynthesis protein TsaB